MDPPQLLLSRASFMKLSRLFTAHNSVYNAIDSGQQHASHVSKYIKLEGQWGDKTSPMNGQSLSDFSRYLNVPSSQPRDLLREGRSSASTL